MPTTYTYYTMTAHCIKMGNFHEWQFFTDWVDNNSEYEYEEREPLGMGGSMEDHLNVFSYFDGDERTAYCAQLDLLILIKVK